MSHYQVCIAAENTDTGSAMIECCTGHASLRRWAINSWIWPTKAWVCGRTYRGSLDTLADATGSAYAADSPVCLRRRTNIILPVAGAHSGVGVSCR
jgi:hypothetical protein